MQGIAQAPILIPFLNVDRKLYGYADLNGDIIVKPQFDEVSWFDSIGLANVRLGSHWSKIDIHGKVLFPFESRDPVRLVPVFGISFSKPTLQNLPEDTLDCLKAFEIDSNHFRVINLENRKFTAAYKISHERIWDNTLHVILSNGVFFGQVSDSLIHVIDTNLTVILIAADHPMILNDHLLTARDLGRTLLFDYKTFKKTPLPFHEILQVIQDSLLIVSDTTSSLRNINWFEKTLKGLSDFNGHILLDLKHLSLSYKGGELLVDYIWQKGYRFLDLQGHPIDTNVYSGFNFQCDSVYMVTKLNNAKQILDMQGRPISKAYDKIQQGPNCKFFRFTDGPYVGLLDTSFTELFRYEADEILSDYPAEFLWIKRNSKIGVVKSNGTIILPPIYDNCQLPNNTYFYVTLDGRKGMYRQDGSVIFAPVYQDLNNIGADGKSYFAAKLNNLITLYDDQFRVIDDSLYKVVINRKVNIERSGGLTYLKDPYGHLIVPPTDKYKGAVVYTDSSWIHLVFRSDHIEVVNEDGKVITDDNIRLSLDLNLRCTAVGLFGVRQGKKNGIINHRGDWIVSLSDQEIIAVTEGLIIIRKAERYTFYNANGQFIAYHNFQLIDIDKQEQIWSIKVNGKYGFVNSLTGKVIAPVIYDNVSAYDDFLAVATSGKTNGSKQISLLDTLGNEIFRVPFDTLFAVDEVESNRRYMAVRNGKTGVIDLSGHIVIPLQYSNLSAYADSTFFSTYSESEGWKLLNSNNQVVFSGKNFPEPRYIQLPDHYYLLSMNGYAVIVNSDGAIQKTIRSMQFAIHPIADSDILLLESNVDGYTYFINATSFVEYKSASQ